MFKVFFLFALIALAYCAPADQAAEPEKDLAGAETRWLHHGLGGWGHGYGRGLGGWGGYGHGLGLGYGYGLGYGHGLGHRVHWGGYPLHGALW